MCLIVAPGRDGNKALLPRDVFDYVYSRNNDGFGAMWVEDGRVNHFKKTDMTADEIYGFMEEYTERFPDVVFHLRYKTHGKIIPGLAHPFRLLKKTRHGKDLFFMHNGVLGQFGNNLSYGQSDTTVFKDKILLPLLTRDPDALDDPEVLAAINKLTSGSRLIFMDSEGKTWRTGESSWNNRYGLTLSNEYMLPAKTTNNVYGHTPRYSNTNTKADLGTEVKTPTKLFVLTRYIIRDGKTTRHWCCRPAVGYVRTDSGLLYKDLGLGVSISHNIDFIPKKDEHMHLPLGSEEENDKVVTLGTPPVEDKLSEHNDIYHPASDDDVEFDDDDIPFEWKGNQWIEKDPVTGKVTEVAGPAPIDQRLRYARIVHNLYSGNVTCRTQLLGDLIGMGDKEMGDFVMEDPGNAHTILAELVEMVLEYNDELWSIDPNHEKVLMSDVIIQNGKTEYHQKAMLAISTKRKAEYDKLVEEKAAKEAA